MSSYPIIKSGIFEAIGTFTIILYTTVTAHVQIEDQWKMLNYQIQKSAMCFYFLLMALMWISHRTSGSQFNPVLSIGLFLVGGLPLANFIMNLFAQFLGTFLGVLALRFFETGKIFSRFDP